MTMTNQLKACPFCGGHAQTDFIDGGTCRIECYQCDCHTAHLDTPEQAIAAWNRRAPVERQAPEWMPIETAPKDKRVLVWSGQEIYAADWAKNIFTGDEAWIVAEWGDDREQVLVRPTHWKPTGAAPAGGETGEA